MVKHAGPEKMFIHSPYSPGLTIVQINKLGYVFMKVMIRLFGTVDREDKTQKAHDICLQVFERLSCG